MNEEKKIIIERGEDKQGADDKRGIISKIGEKEYMLSDERWEEEGEY